MTPEVKKRIEQIRQGIVPEGYVKDKDGIYPRDWASKKIGQWLKLAERSIVLQDEEEYQLVTIRRGFGGVDSRGSFLGKNVLVKNYFIVKTGDFIISKRQIAHGACGIVPPELDGAVVSNEYNVFLPQDGTNIQMFNLMMQLPHYKRLFYLMSDGVHIEKLLFKTQDWMKRTLAMPLLKEQKKIAEILATQDKAIELQARKIEELKRFKKGCLEKMFPRKGQKVPEKRFPGFTDDWEQRKLCELVDVCSGRDYKHLSEGTIPVYGTGGYMLSVSEALSYDRDAIGIGRKGTIDKPFVLKAPFWTVDTLFYAVPEHPECLDFIHDVFQIIDWKKKDESTGVPSLSKEAINDTNVMVPKIDEQIIIGGFFTRIDALITLHQRKLEEMKRRKKALMQLLLMGIVRVQS